MTQKWALGRGTFGDGRSEALWEVAEVRVWREALWEVAEVRHFERWQK